MGWGVPDLCLPNSGFFAYLKLIIWLQSIANKSAYASPAQTAGIGWTFPDLQIVSKATDFLYISRPV